MGTSRFKATLCSSFLGEEMKTHRGQKWPPAEALEYKPKFGDSLSCVVSFRHKPQGLSSFCHFLQAGITGHSATHGFHVVAGVKLRPSRLHSKHCTGKDIPHPTLKVYKAYQLVGFIMIVCATSVVLMCPLSPPSAFHPSPSHPPCYFHDIMAMLYSSLLSRLNFYFHHFLFT